MTGGGIAVGLNHAIDNGMERDGRLNPKSSRSRMMPQHRPLMVNGQLMPLLPQAVYRRPPIIEPRTPRTISRATELPTPRAALRAKLSTTPGW